jgi:hypothetical protein
MLKHDPLAELNARLSDLEGDKKMALVASANDVRARFETNRMEVLAAKKLELAAKVSKVKEDVDQDIDYMIQMFDENPENEMAVISRRVRERLAGEGKALPDGSFPIRNAGDLKNAIRAYGRAKPGSRGRVKRHIMKRAIGLDREELIPENWKGAASDLDEIVASMKARTQEFGTRLGSEFSTNSEALFAEQITEEIIDLTPEEIQVLKEEAKAREEGRATDGQAPPERDADGRVKYTAETQPRDVAGKF